MSKYKTVWWTLMFSLTTLISSAANAFNLFLDNGTFFGPGNAVYNDTGVVGKTTFVDAQVKNIVLTGPLTGFIPFANNGADEPNVIAEKLQKGGIIDGAASDGTLINENADTGLRLNFSDPDTGETADVMVVAEFSPNSPNGGEPIFPDSQGNLTFNPSVLADPGQADQIARFDVSFTTGIAQVPLSLKTQSNEAGGQDNAGPLLAGHTLVGRMGDFDHDGFLDGTLVLATNAPLDLIVARGNPIAQIRPWTSDIPIDPITSSILALSGVVLNYSQVVASSLDSKNFNTAIKDLNSVTQNTRAVLENLRLLLLSDQLDYRTKIRIRILRYRLWNAYYQFTHLTQFVENISLSSNKYHHRRYKRKAKFVNRKITRTFKKTGLVLERLIDISKQNG